NHQSPHKLPRTAPVQNPPRRPSRASLGLFVRPGAFWKDEAPAPTLFASGGVRSRDARRGYSLLPAQSGAAETEEETKGMTDERKTPKIDTLELNRETIQDLTEQEGEQVRGGMRGAGVSDDPAGCRLAGGAVYGVSENPLGC